MKYFLISIFLIYNKYLNVAVNTCGWMEGADREEAMWNEAITPEKRQHGTKIKLQIQMSTN